MKKMAAIFLATLLAAAMTMTVFASSMNTSGGGMGSNTNTNGSGLPGGTDSATGDSGETNSTTDTERKTEVTYTVQPTYTVSIPESVTLGTEATISATNVVISPNQQVVVKLSGTSDEDNAFTVKTAEGAEMTYAITKDGEDVAVGDVVFTVGVESADSTAKLMFNKPENVQFAGTYTGTVTFTISIETTTVTE